MNELMVLLLSAASLGFIHTLLGPDHYVPFIVLSKARNWSQSKTLWITFFSGAGHVGSSVLIGFVGIMMGIGVNRLENIESGRGDMVAWLLMLFGLGYVLYSVFRFFKPGLHKHLPAFLLPKSIRHQTHLHLSDDSSENRADDSKLTPWMLFLIFVFGPCEVLIPLLIFPAYEIHITGMILVSLVFGAATIFTMMMIVFLGFKGIRTLKFKNSGRYFHLIAGIVIIGLGLSMKFLGW